METVARGRIDAGTWHEGGGIGVKGTGNEGDDAHCDMLSNADWGGRVGSLAIHKDAVLSAVLFCP